MSRILIVEDEPGMVEFLRMELELDGHRVDVSYTGLDALERLRTGRYDAILLDIMLPDVDGFEICRRVRQMSDAFIIMITARGETGDRVAGLDSGADDYLVKPFAIEELNARLRALARRARMGREAGEPVLQAGEIVVNLERHRVCVEGRRVELTAREYELLVHFMRNPNRPMTREELLQQVWGFESPVDTNVVDVYVGYLRHKLDPHKRHLKTVRGVGYVFTEAES